MFADRVTSIPARRSWRRPVQRHDVPLFESSDLTGDGAVGFDDLLVLAQQFGDGINARFVRV